MIKRKCAIKIQANFRGMLTRRRFLQWKAKLFKMVVKCQSYVRQKQTCRKWKGHVEILCKAAIKCQSFIRMFLAKCQLYDKKRILAIVRIQSKWRQCLSRTQYKLKRYGFFAIKIQSQVRMIHSKHFYDKKLLEETKAAITIQQYWRRLAVYQVRDFLLRRRDCYQRSLQIRLLESEVRFWSERIQLKEMYFQSIAHQDKISVRKNLETDVSKVLQEIENSEKKFIELKRERCRLSPRLLGHGWDENINESYKHTRHEITKNKLDFLFQNGKKLRETEQEIREKMDELDHAKINRDKWSKFRDDELKQLWRVQRKAVKAKNDKLRQQGPGIEKRKWSMILKNVNGKPIVGNNKPFPQLKIEAPVRKISIANGKIDISMANLMDIIKERGYETRVLQFEEN